MKKHTYDKCIVTYFFIIFGLSTLLNCGIFDVESYPCGDEIDDLLKSRGQSEEVETFTEGGYTSQTYWYWCQGYSKTFRWEETGECKQSTYTFSPIGECNSNSSGVSNGIFTPEILETPDESLVSSSPSSTEDLSGKVSLVHSGEIGEHINNIEITVSNDRYVKYKYIEFGYIKSVTIKPFTNGFVAEFNIDQYAEFNPRYYDNYVFQNNKFYIRNVSANREEFIESIEKFDSPKLFDISPLSPSGFPLYESNISGYLSGFSYINNIWGYTPDYTKQTDRKLFVFADSTGFDPMQEYTIYLDGVEYDDYSSKPINVNPNN
jgi:hypothetical protein